MFGKYGWHICSTITPLDKKYLEDLDIPFPKLSNRARMGDKRGWFREVVIKLKYTTGKIYYLLYWDNVQEKKNKI